MHSIHKVEETMMASSSSSSATSNKKTLKFSQTKPTLFKKGASSSKSSSLVKRRETVFKKAKELSILCGIEVCVIYYGSDGKLRTSSEDRDTVKNMARRYMELSDKKRRKGSVDLPTFLEKIEVEDSKDKKKKERKLKVEYSNLKYPAWDPRFDNYSVEQLGELIHALENKHLMFQQRFKAVVEAQKHRAMMQNMNVQDQRMITNGPPMMNHLQQHPNQGSMYPYNQGNPTFSHNPGSVAAFHQSQSLAPIPSSLTIYQNPNADNYSRLRRVQGNGVNGFQNMLTNNDEVNGYSGLLGFQDTETNQFENPNLQSYNSNLQSYNNLNAEGYLGFRGVQDIGFNGYQNMNLYDNNGNTNGYNNINTNGYNNINTNGFQQQFPQFPNQGAGPASRFGSTYNLY